MQCASKAASGSAASVRRTRCFHATVSGGPKTPITRPLSTASPRRSRNRTNSTAIWQGRKSWCWCRRRGPRGRPRVVERRLRRHDHQPSQQTGQATCRGTRLPGRSSGKTAYGTHRHPRQLHADRHVSRMWMKRPTRATGFATAMIVFDTVYNPENTLLLKDARNRNSRSSPARNVRPPGRRQFELFTGKPAPIATMREALRRGGFRR